MKTIKMKLLPEPYNRVVTGAKQMEFRLYDQKRKMIKLGDFIEFTNTNNYEVAN